MTALQVEAEAVAEAPPKKKTERRFRQLLDERNELRKALAEARKPQRPSPESVQAVLEEGRSRFHEFDKWVNQLRLSPRVMDFLLTQPDAARLLYIFAVGSCYTRQMSGVTQHA